MDAVAWAVTQLGVRGPHDGAPMRYAIRGERPGAWCARFVRQAFAQAGTPLPGNPWMIASVKNMHAALAAQGAIFDLTTRTPRRGDIGFLQKHNGQTDGSGRHVFLLELFDADSGALACIDGNWSKSVMRVPRKIDSRDLWCFARWPIDVVCAS